MNKIFTILLILSANLFAQVTGSTETGKISFLKKGINDIPIISIVEPQLNPDNEINVSENSVAIIVKVTSKSGLKNVLINNNTADDLSDNQFFTNISLKNGRNLVVIKAIDINDATSERKIIITKTNDILGPTIKILEPYASRGVNIIHKNEVIKIKGIALDENGIKEVTVNNRMAELIPTGEFTIDNYLEPGNNKIVVKAIDNKFNVTIDTFTITRKTEEILARGKYLALIVGIDKYRGVWPELRNAVNDAKAVADVLKNQYKFDELYSLYDDEATRKNIIEKFEYLSSRVSKDDNVIIFYSGHGEFKQQLNKGYWVPVDATSKSTADYISNSDIQTFLNGIPSKHTLLISDACFSGDIFRGRTEEIPFEDSDKYFKEVYRKVSRSALTAGGIEPVTDGGKEGHSVFTYYLLKTLQENESKYFTAGQLFNQIHIPIINNSEQIPVYMPIKNTGDEGGQFVFIKK